MNKIFASLGVLSLCLFGFSAWAVQQGIFQSVDAGVQRFFEVYAHNIFLTKIFVAITDIGSPPALLVLFLIALCMHTREHYKVLWRPFIISFASFGIILQVCKSFFSLERPETSLITVLGYGFPSGHSAFAIFFLILSIAVVYFSKRTFFMKAIIVKTLSLFALLIMVSRLYLQVHYFSDVVGGIFLGAAFACFFLSYVPPRVIGYANGKNA